MEAASKIVQGQKPGAEAADALSMLNEVSPLRWIITGKMSPIRPFPTYQLSALRDQLLQVRLDEMLGQGSAPLDSSPGVHSDVAKYEFLQA